MNGARGNGAGPSAGESGNWASFDSVCRWRGEHEGERPAFVFLTDGERETRRLTYGELDRQARSVAAWLQDQGLAGERVLLLYPGGLDFIIGFLGCLYARSVAVPAYPPHPRRSDPRLESIMGDCLPRAVFCVESDREHITRNSFAEGLRVLATDTVAQLGDGWSEEALNLDAVAYLQYTSGSTGDPKGVMVTHGNLLHQAQYLGGICRYNADTVHVSWQPFFHDMGLVGSLVVPAFYGAVAYIMSPPAFLRNPICWLRAISKYRGTGATAPNFAYDLCVTGTTPAQREGLDLSSWEGAWNGAEPIRAETLDRFCEVYEPYGFRRRTHLPSYGMAETTLCVTASRLDRLPVVASFRRERLEHNRAEPCASDHPSTTRLVSSGIMGGGLEVAIVDPETRRRCPEASVGEIWVCGPSVARGYWQRPQETEETFNAYIAGSNEGPFLRTGDLGFLHEGELFVTGRLKDMIVVRGRNVYPQDLELAAQQSHPALQPDACAAFSVEVDGQEALALALEVRREERRRFDAGEVFETVRGAIAEHFGVAVHWLGLVQPRRVPRTSSGKVMRRACRQQYLSGELPLLAQWQAGSGEDPEKPPAAPTAGLVARLRSLPPSSRRDVLVTHLQGEVARALELRTLPDPGTGFERLGIDSMGAVALVNRLQDQLDGALELPTTLLFDQPNIAAVARYIEQSLFGQPEESDASLRTERELDEPVAVVGLACRLPGAPDAEAFWRLLDEGRDAIREVPEDRWDLDEHFDEDPNVPGKMYTRFGGFVDEIEGFDAAFFDISPREAVSMDPQHRHLLEVSWLALEDAGIAPARLEGRPVGVFVGISTNDYQQILAESNPAGTDAFSATGNAHSAAVGRLSFALGLQGPCVAVDTACSSSLVALHQAVQSLRHGECEAALVGGVNAVLSPEITVAFCKARLLSPDGRCKTFDAAADGYVRSDGFGVVVLKRLGDAQRDGDRILGVIRGTAMNQDGRSSGLTAPSGPSQTRVIADALSAGKVAPADVQYLECHGTGTVLGDPIEVQAADAVLSRGRDPNNPLVIGSVKSNLGHLEATAGIAGLIKVILALRHGKVPQSLHFRTPNPHIPWESLAVRVAAAPIPWEPGPRPRIAGVSSFGFAGSNVHTVIEEGPREPETVSTDPAPPGPHLLAISARTEDALTELAGRYARWLPTQNTAALSDICHTTNTGRNHFEHRAVLLCEGRDALQARLEAIARGEATAGTTRGVAPREDRRRVAFLFPGEGLQYSGMARELYDKQPAFRECLDRCAAVYDEIGRTGGSPPLKELMFDAQGMERTDQTRHIRPALYALQVSLAALWRSWGVAPDALLGHSAGEYAAACVAGVFRVEDGLRLVIERARLMETLPAGGAMLSITAPAHAVEAALAGDDSVGISAYNGLNTVISGPAERLDALMQQFEAQERYCAKLPATNAAHSMSVEPILDDFEAYARGIEYAAPAGRLISTLTGAPLKDGEVPDASYWRNQTRRPVHFAQATQALFETTGCDMVVELGPQAELMWLAQMSYRPKHKVHWVSSLAKGRDAMQQMLSAAAQLHANGVNLDFAGMAAGGGPRRRVALPGYPFQHQRYWPGPMGGTLSPELKSYLYQVAWQPSQRPPRELAGSARRSWLVVAGDEELGGALAAELEARGQGPVTRAPMDPETTSPAAMEAALEQARRAGPIDHVVLLAGAGVDPGADAEAVRDAQTRGVNHALLLAQGLISARETARLWMVTRGAHAVLEGEAVDPTHAPLWGFGRTFAVEHPDRYGGLIDLPLDAGAGDAAAELARALVGDDGETQVALRDGRRWLARLERQELPAALPQRLRGDASYLITGGTGALGLALARRLAERGAGQIVLTSRSGGGDAARTLVEELAGRGCHMEVVRADVAERSQAEQLIDELQGAAPQRPLRGIIHAAGVLEGAPTVEQTPDLLAKVMAPKVWGAWNLHRLSVDRGIELDFFVAFSSGASLLGLRGHGNYSAANAYLDSLAQHRRGLGLAGVAINWGPWAEEGMATRMEAGTWEDIGTHLIRPRTAMRAFERLADGGAAQVLVQPMNWPRWAELARSGRLPPILLKLLESPLSEQEREAAPARDDRTGSKGEVGELVARLRSLAPHERRPALETHIRERVAAVLGVAPEKIDPEAGFFDLGMNSIMAVELRTALQAGLGDALELQAAVVFNYPSVRKIAEYLSSTLFTEERRAPAQPGADVRLSVPTEARGVQAADLSAALEAAAAEVLGAEARTPEGGEGEEEARKRQALAAILALRSELDSLRSQAAEPVAVIGLGCRYPGGEGPEALWRTLDAGGDEITEVPPDRWDTSLYRDGDPDAAGSISTTRGGFVGGIDLFDAAFFDMSPREARSLDPQQRMLMEVAWHALEHANVAPRRLRGARGGVFVGISVSDYAERVNDQGVDAMDAYAATGNALCAAAGRLAFTLGWHGPALAIDTACSSSLVSLHEACASLRASECDIALAGGVSVVLNPTVSLILSRAQMLSPDGRCKTFDAAADGYVRGEGCGMVVLKRLRDARRDGDRVLAVIRGSAVNQDGRSSGLTVPNGLAQERVIADALRTAGVEPAAVQYLEAHGTGTSLGDPIEVQAADTVLSHGRDCDHPLLIGSIKTNIGHTESAAGIAGVIKVILALQHEKLPQSLHFKTPNPHIPWDQLNVKVVSEPVPWPAGGDPRIAGVSSFGFVGTNAHVVLEEAPARPASHVPEDTPPERDAHVLALSARTNDALKALAGRYAEWTRQHAEASFADLCNTANTARDHFEHRAALVFESADELQAQLRGVEQDRDVAGTQRGRVALRGERRTAFLFTGQGSQWVGMGLALYEVEPIFRAHFDRCAERYRALRGDGPGLHQLVFEDDGQGLLDQTGYTQPALYALEVSLAALWRSWGVEPDVVLGHSVGEYAAACVAGVFDLEDGLELIAERGRLMQGLPAGGGMLSVSGAASTVEEALRGRPGLCIAAYNGADTVISGGMDELETLRARFEADGVRCRRLATSHAFHSPRMEPILEEFRACAARLTYRPAGKRLISNVTGEPVAEHRILDADYWTTHIRAPVQFERGVHTLRDLGCNVLLEIGPHPVLVGMGQRCWSADQEPLWVGTLRRRRNDVKELLRAAAALYTGGVEPDFAAMDTPWQSRRRKVDLPPYPFQRRRYWVETSSPADGAPGARMPECLYRVGWQPLDSKPPADATRGPETWLLFTDQAGVGTALRRELESSGRRCVCVPAPEDATAAETALREAIEAARRDGAAPLTHAVHLWSLDRPRAQSADELWRAQEQGVESVLDLARTLADDGWQGRLWLVTRETQRALESDGVDATHSPIWGLGKVIGLEHPELWGGLIDLPGESDGCAPLLLATLASDDGEDMVALRHRRRWVARLERQQPADAPPLPVDQNGTYLVTGGLGGVGLKLAERLVARGARHLALSGRSAPSASAREAIASLEGRGCAVRVVQADVSREPEVTRLLDGIRDSGSPPLRGIVHAAGVDALVPLRELDRDELRTTLAAKMVGAWLLDRLTTERGIELALFLCTSSIASVWGGMSQGAYSAANAFLDSLAARRRAEGQAATAVNYGPWSGVGMGAANEEGVAWLRSRGIRALAPELALDATEAAVDSGLAGVVAADMDWSKFRELAELQRPRPLLEKLGPAKTAEQDEAAGSPVDTPLVTQLTEAAPGMRLELLTEVVKAELARVLEKPVEEIDDDTGFFDLGMDSLMAVEFRNALSSKLGRKLSATIVMDRPDIGALSAYIVEEVLGLSLGKAAPGARRPSSQEPGADTTASEVDALSPGEVGAALEDELKEILGE